MGATQLNTAPPDFVGVGVQRSGTSWWFQLLLDHPEIQPPLQKRKKELHFFGRFCSGPMSDEDVARYHGLFPNEPGMITGEWTPRYMFDFWTPRLLRRAAPDAKILVLLRDPIERYRSGVPHQTMFTPKRGDAAIAADAVQRGCYATQLRRVLAHFDPEQVLVLQYERCALEPLEEYARTLRFLGVRDDFEPSGVGELRGRTRAADKEPLWPELLDDLHDTLDPEIRDLQALVPGVDLSLWPNFAHLAAAGAVAEGS